MIDFMAVGAIYAQMEADRRAQEQPSRLVEIAERIREEPKTTEDMSIRRHFDSDGDLEALFGVVK